MGERIEGLQETCLKWIKQIFKFSPGFVNADFWSLEALGEMKPPILDPCLVDNQDSPFRFGGCSDSGFHLGEGGGQNKRVNLEKVEEVLWRPM